MKIYQKFNLNTENLEERAKDESTPIGDRVASLKKELSKKGYEVLVSNEFYFGIPMSIIFGAKYMKADVKQDFYSLTERLKLPFLSGEFYVPYNSRSEMQEAED